MIRLKAQATGVSLDELLEVTARQGVQFLDSDSQSATGKG